MNTLLWIFLLSEIRFTSARVMYSSAYFTPTIPYGLSIIGHTSAKFELKGCKNIQIGLITHKRANLGYVIRFNTKVGGSYKASIIRRNYKTVVYKAEVVQSASFFTCSRNNKPSSQWHWFWYSWNECTIRMGRGQLVGQQEVISCTETDMVEFKYHAMGSSDGRTSIVFRIVPPMVDDFSVSTTQMCTCDERNRPGAQPMTKMTFNMSNVGKAIGSGRQVIVEHSGMTLLDCSVACVNTVICIKYSHSTSGICRLSGSCQPALEADATFRTYTIKSWINAILI